MAAQIHEIATGAGTVLLDPILLIVLTLSVLAITTGIAGRVVVILEDLRYNRIHSRKG